MREHITSERTANAIMQDKTFDGPYLIVEGNKDYKFYSKFLNTENDDDKDDTIRIRQAGGKERVKDVIKILNKRNFYKKIGIIDADFSYLLEEDQLLENIFYTDYHDIEVMMFNSPALENVINKYTTSEKLKNFLDGRKIRDILLRVAKEIGILRLANYKYELGLAFKPKTPDGNKIKYIKFIDVNTLEIQGVDRLISVVYDYSVNRSNVASKEDIKEKFKELSKKEYDVLHLVNGHDLSNILFILLKKSLSIQKRSLTDCDVIEDDLILSYEARYFIETKLFQSLYKWSEKNNAKIFKEDIEELYQKMILMEV